MLFTKNVWITLGKIFLFNFLKFLLKQNKEVTIS